VPRPDTLQVVRAALSDERLVVSRVGNDVAVSMRFPKERTATGSRAWASTYAYAATEISPESEREALESWLRSAVHQLVGQLPYRKYKSRTRHLRLLEALQAEARRLGVTTY